VAGRERKTKVEKAVAEGGKTSGWQSHGRTRRWQQSGHGRRGRRGGSDWAADGWAPAISYFPKLSKPAQTWKLKMDALPCSKNSKMLHAARLRNYEQFYQF
jgi:hypothetical protein